MMPKISKRNSLSSRASNLVKLLSQVKPVPDEWLTSKDKNGSGGYNSEEELILLECTSYKDLALAWKKAIKFTKGLDHGLSAMLAASLSTNILGEQIWLKVIGPASCGKSTLAEALSANKKYVIAKDTFTGLTSGYQSQENPGKNLSLVELLADKTLIINDGDTLLQLPNLSQIVSQMRAFYGGNLRTQYKNEMSKDHEGVHTTIIICGTSSLRVLDKSELGARFLDCVIMDEIDDELEDEILWRVANKTDRNMALEANGDAASQEDPRMILVKQLTGGYINYLRDNAVDLVSAIHYPSSALRQCTKLGKFVAYMRARPSYLQDESAERELAARLVIQHTKLAKCIAAVLNEKAVNDRVMGRVTEIALNTSRGTPLEIVKLLYGAEKGVANKGIAMNTGKSDYKTTEMLQFMRQIGVTTVETKKTKGFTGQSKWHLTPKFTKLYAQVMGEDE